MGQRIFISSVQREFAKERKALDEYVRKDAILGRFFDVFLFEEVPAQEQTGTGTGDIIARCREWGLSDPQWQIEDDDDWRNPRTAAMAGTGCRSLRRS